MPAQEQIQERLGSRMPLFGRFIRSAAARDLAMAAERGDLRAVRILCQALTGSPYPDTRTKAREALCAIKNPRVVDAVCGRILETGDPVLLSLARERGFLPEGDGKRALFSLLSGQAEECLEHDPLPGHPLLADALNAATPAIRSLALERARELGMADLFVSPGRQGEVTNWTPQEWGARVAVYQESGEWDELFSLLFRAPVSIAVEIVHVLAVSGWRPSAADEGLWNDLVALAPERWEYPDPPRERGMVLAGNGGLVAQAAISPCGQHLATLSYDGTVSQWSIPKGRLLSSTRPCKGGVVVLAFSHDGNTLALGCEDGTVLLMEPGKGELFGSLRAGDTRVTALLFPSCDGRIISGSGDGTVRSWHGPEYDPASCMHIKGGTVTALAAWGNLVAAGRSDGSLSLWDGTSGHTRILRGPASAIRHLSFLLEGEFLAGIDMRGTLHAWNIGDGSRCASLVSVEGRLLGWSVTPAGDLWAVAPDRHTVAVVSLPRGDVVLRLDVPGKGITCLALHPDGTHLVAGCRDGYIHTWSIPDGTKCSMVKGHTDRVQLVAVTRDGAGIVTAGWDGTVRLRAMPGGEILATMQGPGNAIHCLAATLGGELLACGSEGGILRVWDAGTGELVHWHDLVAGRVDCLALHPAGTIAACGDSRGLISLYSVERGSLLATLEGHEGGIHVLAVDAGGSLLASGGWDGSVRVWSLPGGECLARLDGHGSSITSLAFSPDSSLLVSGSLDRSAIVWNVAERRIHTRIVGHSHVVSCLGITGDGRVLATGSWDGTVRLWSLPSGELQGDPLAHGGRVLSLSVYPDGSLIGSAADDGNISLWELPGGTLIRRKAVMADARNGICLVPGRNLLAIAARDGTLRTMGIPWTRPLSRTTPSDISFVRSCLSPGLPLNDARQWQFLERLLAGRFRQCIEYAGDGLPAGTSDIEIVDEAGGYAVIHGRVRVP